jgi:chaperonin cofactor prefoldin
MSKKKVVAKNLEEKVDDLEWKIIDLERDLAKSNRQNHLLWELFKTMKTELYYE